MSLRATQAALLSLSAMFWLVLVDAARPFPSDVEPCKLKADPGTFFSSGFGYQMDCVPPVGTVKASMIFVDFPDAPSSEESPRDLADIFLNDSINWFAQMSYNRLKLEITPDLRKFYRMDGSSNSYSWGRDGFSAEIHWRYIMDALNSYTYSGQFAPAAEILYIVPTASAKDIWTSFTFNYRLSDHNGDMMFRRVVTLGQDAFDRYGFPALNHETGHCFCLPDLYPPRSVGEMNLYVGGWDVMGISGGPSPDLFAWDKWRLGWLADDNFACVSAKGTSKHVLTPLFAETPGTKAVVIARDKAQVLVAEARIDGGVDTGTCNPGVLLYTVAVNVPTFGGPIRVLDANPHTNGCNNDPLNDATLHINGTKSINVPDWGLLVEIVEQTDQKITINVAYQ